MIKSSNDVGKLLETQRLALKLDQSDMKMRIGMTQQQYQKIEEGSNTTINTLLRILEGLDMEMTITPKNATAHPEQNTSKDPETVMNDIWGMIDKLGDE